MFFSCLSSCYRDDGQQGENGRATLPYLGLHETTDENGDPVKDTLYYQVPKFSFVDHDSLIISHNDYAGHIYVADFFFTHCPSICPIMSSQMARLYVMLEEAGLLGEVKLLSHTVDPARDHPARLKEYKNQLGVPDDENWRMVTGDPADLRYQTEQGYMVTAFESDTAAGGFFHTDQFVLVDRKMHIRGYYDGTSTAAVNRLFEDIKILAGEND
jgi:protein SCO1